MTSTVFGGSSKRLNPCHWGELMRISATIIKHRFLIAAAFAAWTVSVAPQALAADHAVIVMYHRYCTLEARQVYRLAVEENRRGD